MGATIMNRLSKCCKGFGLDTYSLARAAPALIARGRTLPLLLAPGVKQFSSLVDVNLYVSAIQESPPLIRLRNIKDPCI